MHAVKVLQGGKGINAKNLTDNETSPPPFFFPGEDPLGGGSSSSFILPTKIFIDLGTQT